MVIDVGRDALETEIGAAASRHEVSCGCRACALMRAVWTLAGGDGDGGEDEEEMVPASS